MSFYGLKNYRMKNWLNPYIEIKKEKTIKPSPIQGRASGHRTIAGDEKLGQKAIPTGWTTAPAPNIGEGF